MATSTGGRSPGQTVQEVLREDAIAPPEVLLHEYPPEFVDNRELSIDRYLTQEWHDLEVEQVWRRVWQMACRLEELPAIGDHVVYEVATESVIVVRTGEEPHDVRAYVNSCLHRGTQLRTEGGNVQRFRCPFHGFTWDLEGELVHVPNSWDFPDVAPQDFCLPTAKIAFWGGFVFVNFDDDCEPFDSYIEVLDDEFKDFPLEDRWKAAHVER